MAGYKYLDSFIDNQRANGKYSFTLEGLHSQLGVSESAASKNMHQEYFEPHRSGDGDSTLVKINPKGDTTRYDNWRNRGGLYDTWGKKVVD